MLEVNFSRHAEKFLRKVHPKHARQIAGKVMALREAPEPYDSIILKGQISRYRRTDIGEYRIVYRVNAGTLEVVLIGKRNDDEVYKKLKRLL